jgi:hypothetical protein
MTDPVLARLAEGIGLRLQGHVVEARARMRQLWDEIGGAAGDPLLRCAIAHSLADAQEDVHAELGWDIAALAAARAVTDDDVVAAGMEGSAAALFPSLHLNVGESYRRIGALDRARQHLEVGLRTTEVLPDGEYADMIRGGFADPEERLRPSRAPVSHHSFE